MKNLKDYRFILIDMDGTLVRTASGLTFPKTEHDWVPILEMYDALKKNKPEYIHIVSNQGNMAKKNGVNEEAWREKAEYICKCLQRYTGANAVTFDYCTTTDKTDPKRKPNTGMFVSYIRHLKNNFIDVRLNECLMIGDASGKLEQFSDSDLMFAKNCGIDYIDAAEYIRISLALKK